MTDCRSTHISMNDPISFHDTCALIFIAALFTMARTWQQPKCSMTNEWRKKTWYMNTMEYYSVTKRNEIGSFVESCL